VDEEREGKGQREGEIEKELCFTVIRNNHVTLT